MTTTEPGVVFLCGFPSSGTDLLKNLLNAHPQIYIGGEFPRLPALAREYSATVPAAKLKQAVDDIVASDIYGNLARKELRLTPGGPACFRDLYVDLLCPREVRWTGNKTPQNAENVDNLNNLFPDARFVLIVRDVRDVALSWRKKWGKDPSRCADRWGVRMLMAVRLLEQHAAGRFLRVSYEHLIASPAEVARDVCTFLNLPFDPRMERYHEFVEERVAGKLNYGEPVIAANTEKWRNDLPQFEVRRIEEIAWTAINRFGYAPAFATGPRGLSRWERIRGTLRDASSLVFVGNRALHGRSFRDVRHAVGHEIAKRFGKFRTARRNA